MILNCNARRSKTVRAGAKPSPFLSDRTVLGMFRFKPQTENQDSAKTDSAVEESQDIFASQHSEYVVDPESMFSMIDPRNINSILFASSIKSGKSPLEFLLAAEFKYFVTKKVNKSWIEHEHSLLSQLLTAMIGSRAILGLYMSDEGVKLLYMDPQPDQEGFTECCICDAGEKILSFTDPESLRIVKELFYEVLRLSLIREEPAETLEAAAKHLENQKNDIHRQFREGKKRQREASRDHKLRFKTVHGRVVNAARLDVATRLNTRQTFDLVKKENERAVLLRFNEQQSYDYSSDSED